MREAIRPKLVHRIYKRTKGHSDDQEDPFIPPLPRHDRSPAWRCSWPSPAAPSPPGRQEQRPLGPDRRRHGPHRGPPRQRGHAPKIAADAVGTEEIAENAVASPEVAPDSLTAERPRRGLGRLLRGGRSVADRRDLGPDSVGASEMQRMQSAPVRSRRLVYERAPTAPSATGDDHPGLEQHGDQRRRQRQRLRRTARRAPPYQRRRPAPASTRSTWPRSYRSGNGWHDRRPQRRRRRHHHHRVRLLPRRVIPISGSRRQQKTAGTPCPGRFRTRQRSLGGSQRRLSLGGLGSALVKSALGAQFFLGLDRRFHVERLDRAFHGAAGRREADPLSASRSPSSSALFSPSRSVSTSAC